MAVPTRFSHFYVHVYDFPPLIFGEVMIYESTYSAAFI